ncbi:tetratricopeptide repeat protein [Maribacter sp. CXY002]|uniref:ATP-binding protein n=1 Tax=Maribacter luteocoastalis TaxID=3407671 RepID=UPI003B685958
MRLHILCFLLPLIALGQGDSIKVKALLDKAYGYEGTDPIKALKMYSKAYILSNRSGYDLGAFRSLHYSGIVHSNMVNYDSALFYYKKSLTFSDKAKYPKGKAATYINMGNVYQFLGDYDKVAEHYLKGIQVFETLKDSTSIAITYENLGALFSAIQQHQKEMRYLEKALLMAPKDDFRLMGMIYGDMGLSQSKIGNLPKTFTYFTKADSLSRLVDDPKLDFFVDRNFGEYHLLNGSYKTSISFLNKALKANEAINDPYYRGQLFVQLGEAHTKLKEYPKATSYLQMALTMGRENKIKEIQEKAYYLLSKIDKEQRNHQRAYEYLDLHMHFKDSLLNETYLRQISLFEKQYETEKKDKEIASQKLLLQTQENSLLRKKNQYNLALGGVGFLGLFGLGLWLFYRQRQKLRSKEILALQNQQEVVKLEALIDGEEKERNRLAQDLHDGINGDLAVIKYKISSLETNKFSEREKKYYLDAISMLDNAVEQVRRISHNLAPPSLHNFDLIEAIQQFCSKQNASNSLNISFQYFGNRLVLKKEIETAIYRIIQELLNNSIKHANATEALVQLNTHEDKLIITVEDNGKGFDASISANGIGLQNIKSRVNFLKANLDISSSTKGTTFCIEIDLHKLDKK